MQLGNARGPPPKDGSAEPLEPEGAGVAVGLEPKEPKDAGVVVGVEPEEPKDAGIVVGLEPGEPKDDLQKAFKKFLKKKKVGLEPQTVFHLPCRSTPPAFGWPLFQQRVQRVLS